METIGYYFGVSKQAEVLVLTLIGIACTIFDASLFDLNSNLHKVWALILDPTKFSGQTETFMKYLLTGIVLVRTLSVHIYLAFYIVMLWPAIFEERPALLIPWLMVGAVKCLSMGALSFATGSYICFVYGPLRASCLDFVLAQFIDHSPSIYMWCSVLSYYRELKQCIDFYALRDSRHEEFTTELVKRRRRVRSLTKDFWPNHKVEVDEDRNLISVSTIENILQHLETDLHRSNTRSLDSLLGKMAAEDEKEELWNAVDALISSDDEGKTVAEKAAKLLKLSVTDIVKARDEVRSRHGADYSADELQKIETIQLQKRKRREEVKSAEVANVVPKELKLRPTVSEKACGCCQNPIEFMDDIPETEIRSYVSESCSVLYQKDVKQPETAQTRDLIVGTSDDLSTVTNNEVTEFVAVPNKGRVTYTVIETTKTPENVEDVLTKNTKDVGKKSLINEQEFISQNNQDSLIVTTKLPEKFEEAFGKDNDKEFITQNNQHIIRNQSDNIKGFSSFNTASSDKITQPAVVLLGNLNETNKKTSDRSCQVSTLSRSVLNASPSQLKLILGEANSAKTPKISETVAKKKVLLKSSSTKP